MHNIFLIYLYRFRNTIIQKDFESLNFEVRTLIF